MHALHVHRLLLLSLCLSMFACVTTRPVQPLSGEPTEVEDLFKEQGVLNDQRPASVRTVDRFFRALESGDGDLCWYLLDLRAAAAWQVHQSRSGGADAGPTTIVRLLNGDLPNVKTPSALKRVKLSPNRTASTVSVSWGAEPSMEIVLAMNQDGWRLVLPPRGSALPRVEQNPRSSQRATPIDFEEIHNKDSTSPRNQGGMGGAMGRF